MKKGGEALSGYWTVPEIILLSNRAYHDWSGATVQQMSDFWSKNQRVASATTVDSCRQPSFLCADSDCFWDSVTHKLLTDIKKWFLSVVQSLNYLFQALAPAAPAPAIYVHIVQY